jgi:FkbM family methyltransferase
LTIKRLVKHLLHRIGLVVVRRDHTGVRYLETPPAGPFEEVLLRLFPSLHGLNFIQVGANDGRRADPIAAYVARFDWGGLMLEPLPAMFAALRRNRGESPRLTFLNAALDERTGSRSIFQLRPDLTGLPDWAWGLASFDRERVGTAAKELGLAADAVETLSVATVTWDEVWQKFGHPVCDVLVIDTEGYDIALLRWLDLARRRPRVIHFEHACVNGAERLAFYGHLLEHGYEIATSGPDTIAYLPV